MNVYILLDRSGSMATLWSEALGSINTYVSKLKKKDMIHMAVFDDRYDVIRDCPAEHWADLTDEDAQPRGMTALYDSCGKIMTQAEEDGQKKTILVVMTDGHENASREYSQTAIKAKVKEFEDRNWEVIFLGANFDSVATVSGAVGVGFDKTMNISASNLRSTMDAFSLKSAAYATSGQSIVFTDEDKMRAVSPNGN
jgi:hypothetical protein